ncbi:carbohydrate ABC transporter permease [Inquilinus limosus]|uniref:ABC transporter permease n=1 Tax=Inquilinus limosus TaxID=171674 RepID=A0A211ZUQ5_9PROT|nr:sugar ABC transporter permease [Inquilinus limosus]OWJ68886.1 ABC transporter permease [Inquilinus limosus]
MTALDLPAAPAPARRLGPLGRLSESRRWAYYLLLPSLVLILAVVLYPTLWGMVLSVREMRLNRVDLGTGFVGLKHYLALVGDPVFWLSLQNTVIWVAGAAAGELLLGLLTALVLNTSLPGFRVLGILVLLPWFLPNVVAGHMWALMLDPRLGVLNDILVRIGILGSYKAWFADPDTAMAAAMVVEVWHGFPFFALLLLAALKGIPGDLYEAAATDGAGLWRQFVHVTLPQLRVVIVATVVLRVISLVNSPDILLILTGGGPGRSTQVLSLYAFLKANKEFNFGYASALSVVMFLLLMVFSYAYVKLSNAMRD